ncbi:MAG: hypothetical protein ACR2QG_12595 [Gammaproteobacteria bacterium]
MNRINHLLILGVLMALGCSSVAHAAGNSLASTLEVFVFPSDGQDSSQQSKDESACYSWAVDNTGTDPFDLAKDESRAEQQSAQAEQKAAQVGRGSGGRGMLRGAAVGALIGEIADDDSSKGAAWGAAIGGSRSAARGQAARSQAQTQAEQQSRAQKEDFAKQGENFKKAFSVCLEAKSYMVKY